MSYIVKTIGKIGIELLLIILLGILFYQNEKIYGFMVLLMLAAFVFIRFARTKDDDKLDIRSNSMLINFYVRTAFFLFILVGITFLIYTFDYIVLCHWYPN